MLASRCISAIIACWLIVGCNEQQVPVFHYQQPAYKNIHLSATTDTLRFSLPADSYNSARSFNCFTDQGKEYIAFYDKQSISVNIYVLSDQQLFKRIPLKPIFHNKNLEKQTTVFVKSLDSIFVINKLTLFLLNKSLSIIDSVDFIDPVLAYSSFEKGSPPVFLHNKMYTLAKPYLSAQEKGDCKKWKNLYEVDWKNKRTTLLYTLPQVYRDSMYDYYFFDVSYCVNNKGRIVFSFPADSNIYETDLGDYHAAYFAKSIYQKQHINATTKEELAEEDGLRKVFLLRDSYGNIYFDPYHKMYLRVAQQKITERDYMLGKKNKDRTVIFLDENFTVIGEAALDKDIVLSTIFFTRDGSMYTRANAKDEDALQFVRLEYKIEDDSSKYRLATH
jgi:hypothetical protein